MVRRLEELDADVSVIRSSSTTYAISEPVEPRVDGAEVVVHLAARVGGIGYNRRNPAPLAYDNLIMAANIFEASRKAGVAKLVSACSVCAYPKFTPVPVQGGQASGTATPRSRTPPTGSPRRR